MENPYSPSTYQSKGRKGSSWQAVTLGLALTVVLHTLFFAVIEPLAKTLAAGNDLSFRPLAVYFPSSVVNKDYLELAIQLDSLVFITCYVLRTRDPKDRALSVLITVGTAWSIAAILSIVTAALFGLHNIRYGFDPWQLLRGGLFLCYFIVLTTTLLRHRRKRELFVHNKSVTQG